MKTNERNITKIIKEICAEEQIKLTSYSFDYVLRLTKGQTIRHIIGCKFELNSSVAGSICKDKSATSSLLDASGIANIEHKFFMSPSDVRYTECADNGWMKMLGYLEKYGKIVCKPNESSGGNNVFLVKNHTELEKAVAKIFQRSRAMAICPYEEIENEYRVVVLDDKVKLIFSKEIPRVIGNGRDTVLKLVAEQAREYNLRDLDERVDFYAVPEEGEIVALNWKHNLQLGASAEVVDGANATSGEADLAKVLGEIALKATKILNIRFASVDIVRVGGEYKILEINSVVIMNSFASESAENYRVAKEIYREALLAMFV